MSFSSKGTSVSSFILKTVRRVCDTPVKHWSCITPWCLINSNCDNSLDWLNVLSDWGDWLFQMFIFLKDMLSVVCNEASFYLFLLALVLIIVCKITFLYWKNLCQRFHSCMGQGFTLDRMPVHQGGTRQGFTLKMIQTHVSSHQNSWMLLLLAMVQKKSYPWYFICSG